MVAFRAFVGGRPQPGGMADGAARQRWSPPRAEPTGVARRDQPRADRLGVEDRARGRDAEAEGPKDQDQRRRHEHVHAEVVGQAALGGVGSIGVIFWPTRNDYGLRRRVRPLGNRRFGRSRSGARARGRASRAGASRERRRFGCLRRSRIPRPRARVRDA